MPSIVRWLRLAACLVLVVAGSAAAQDLAQPGPFAAGERTVTVTRPNGSTFAARLYYPATSAGAGAPFDASGAPYPAISFGHGFAQPADAYASTLRHLATWGHVVIATTSQGTLFPSHAAFADDLRACLTWCETQNATSGSTFFGAIDVGAFGLCGHSMGAGAAILAAAVDPRVRALVPIAPAETSPSAIGAIASVRVPTRIVCGGQDAIVSTSTNGLPMYRAAAGPRQLLVIAGAFHCGFEDAPALGGFGCDSGSLTRDEQLAITRRHLTAFFLLHLRGDDARWSAVWGPAALADATTTIERDADGRILPSVARAAGAPGTTIDYALDVRNDGAVATRFHLAIEGQSWPTQSSSALTAVLAPGQSETIHVRVDVPVAPARASDRCVVSARSDLDGHTRFYARLGSRRL